MTDDEYQTLRQQIVAEYKANLSALERVYEIAKTLPKRLGREKAAKNGVPAQEPEIEEEQDQEESSKGAVLRAVRATVENMDGAFGWVEVAEILRRDRPEREWQDTSVRQAVRKLAENGELDIAQAGAGRRPSLYEKP